MTGASERLSQNEEDQQPKDCEWPEDRADVRHQLRNTQSRGKAK